MEEILYSQHFFTNEENFRRSLSTQGDNLLFGKGIVDAGLIPKWKESLWESNSVEPAMLRVPIVILAFIVLWGINIVIFDKFKLQYTSVMSIKSVSLGFIFVTATAVATTYAICMTVMCNLAGFGIDVGVGIFYLLISVAYVFSILPGSESVNHFFSVTKLVFVPSSTIAFPEILLADAFTSLSKVFKDFGVTAVVIYSRFAGTSPVMSHDMGMLLVAILASLPFLLRIRQCSVQFFGAADSLSRLPIFLNIMKYFSAFPPIWLTAAASFGYFHPSLPLLTAVMASVNSIYSFLWDIIMDWGLISFTKSGKVYWRPRLLLPYTFHILAAIINLVLRFSWAANRIVGFKHLHPSHLILLVELAEVFRRSMWNIFRVEWEIIVKQTAATVSKNQDDYRVPDSDVELGFVDHVSQGKSKISQV